MKKLKLRRSIILYAAAGFGVNLLNTMMGSYLCSALLIGGFDKEVIPYQTYAGRDLVIPGALGLWAIMVFISKIIDGIIDVPMASITDNLRSRFGRRRPSILIGFIPMILAYLLFLVIPQPQGATVLNTVYYGVVLCLFYTSYTLTMVSYYATFTEIVETPAERNLMSSAKSVFDIFYFIIGYVVVRMMLNGLNIRLVALIVLPLSLTMMIPMFMIKEPSNLTAAGEKTKSVNLFRSIAYTFKNRAFIVWMVVYSFMTFGVQLFLGGINEYFSFVKMDMIFVMMSAFAPVPFTLILYNYIIKKKGFGFAYRYILIVFAIGMAAMFGVGSLEAGTLKTVLSIVTGLISSFGIGAMFAVAYSVPSQLAADEAKKTGVSNSAMYFAVQGLFAGVATGIATGIVLNALKGSEEQKSGAIFYMTLICAVAMVVALALSFILPKRIVYMGKENKKDESNGKQ